MEIAAALRETNAKMGMAIVTNMKTAYQGSAATTIVMSPLTDLLKGLMIVASLQMVKVTPFQRLFTDQLS